jgi:glutathionylspermidine synthase
MERVTVQPRDGWQSIVESQGMFHTEGGEPYWDESACYRFTPADVEQIEQATYALNELCLAAVQHVVEHHEDQFPLFCIPHRFWDYFLQSWERDEHTLYGRYDLAFDGNSPPKLLEFNADTPTALLEASVIQWHWMKDRQNQHAGPLDQFNNIHERLIEAWQSYKPEVRDRMCFTATPGHLEDYMTVTYLRDTAIQAGLDTRYLDIDWLRWDAGRNTYVQGIGQEGDRGYHEVPVYNLFKLYPWEWLIREEFGRYLPASKTRWLEPPWKLLLSNKAILPVLYRLSPDCPYLLRTAFEPWGDSYVKKPAMAREGACVTIVRDGGVLEETGGPEFYQSGPFVYQELCLLPEFDGRYPVVGSWLVNGWACGVGIREGGGLITGNTSRFLPHLVTS